MRPAMKEVRTVLDAFRHIVQALRTGRGGNPAGLSSAQLFALQLIAEHPDASINDVAALTFTHQSSVSVVIQRLVRKGLVARQASRDDRRRLRLVVTTRGRQALIRAPVAAQEHLIAAIVTLPTTDRRTLGRVLGRVARALTPAGAGVHPPMFFEGGRGPQRSRARRTTTS